MDCLDNLQIKDETVTFSEFNVLDLAEFFKSLDLLDFELLKPEMKKTFVPSVLGNDVFRINKIKKYPELFGDTYDVYTYEESPLKKKPICLSYSLFSLTKEDLRFPIESLLNLYKTCQIVQEKKEERIIVRLYANPDIFLQDSLKTKTTRVTRSLLNKLLEFEFFEFHQIFCKETIPDLERQRMFRFFSIFDSSVSIIACKDIDSVLTDYELDNMLYFLKDDTKSLLYYDLYNDDLLLASLKYTSVEIEIPISISILGKRTREGKRTFYYQFLKENPPWLVWYQLIFNDQKFKYQIPAGAVLVKSGLISYEMFLDCYKKVIKNVEKLKKKRGLVKKLPSLKQRYNRGGKEEEDSIFEIGFDEILLMNLFQFIDLEKVVCLNTHLSTYRFPKEHENENQKLFSTRAHLNNYITRFKFSENMDKIFFTPTCVDENSKYNSLLVNVFD